MSPSISRCCRLALRSIEYVYVVLLLSAGGMSCSSSPSLREKAEAQTGRAAAPAAESEGALSAKAEPSLKSKVFFNLTPVSLPSGSLPAASASTPAAEEAHASALLGSTEARREMSSTPHSSNTMEKPPLGRVPEETLVSELSARWTREWVSLSGGFGQVSIECHDLHILEASKHILALSFLRKDHGADDEIVQEAIRAAFSDSAGDDHRLLAAACLSHEGKREQVRDVLASLAGEEAETIPTGSEGLPQGRFEVVGLAFARSIEGPGEFTRAEEADIGPGKSILVYGEFRNFRSVREQRGDAKEDSYRRVFQASLRILSAEGEEIDRLEFLPESRGRQLASSPAEVMNFWARYKIAADMRPGSYKLVVDARDMLAEAVASAEVEFQLAEKR